MKSPLVWQTLPVGIKPSVYTFARIPLWLVPINGNTTRLVLSSKESSPHKFLAEQDFKSSDLTGLTTIVLAKKAKTGKKPSSACFDLADPVSGDRAHLTNFPWNLEKAALVRNFDLDKLRC